MANGDELSKRGCGLPCGFLLYLIQLVGVGAAAARRLSSEFVGRSATRVIPGVVLYLTTQRTSISRSNA